MPPQHVVLFSSSAASEDGLAAWAERMGRRSITEPVRGRLRFAFYGRVSTEDHQDPVTSWARQRDQAVALVAGHGRIVAEYFDTGQSRTLPWARRPQAAALLAAMAYPGRGSDAIVIGEYERAFYGGQYAAMAPLFEHYGIQLWTPESSGPIDFQADEHEQMMLALGWQSKREITRTRIRVRTAMAAQTREQGRYLGGRPPYGYGLADAGPHPNKAHAAWTAGASPGTRSAHRAGCAVDVCPAAGRAQPGPDHPRPQRRRDSAPVRSGPRAEPAPQRASVDTGHCGGDPGQPALYRAAGVEPAAHGSRPDRPGQHRAWPPAGPAVESAGGVGHLQSARPPGAGQRGCLHRRPRDEYPARPRRPSHTPVPAGWADPLRDLRAQAGIVMVERPPRLPVPPRVHQCHPPRPHPGEERLRPRGPDHAAPGSLRHPACRPRTRPRPSRPGQPGRQSRAGRRTDRPSAIQRPHAWSGQGRSRR
jgi:DNA invertase Pin-like site-specific DNA recombinase